MLRKVLSGGLAVLSAWQRLHVSALIGMGQHQRLHSGLVRYVGARAQVTLPMMITGSAAASGVPIEVLGGMFRRP